MGRGKKTGKTGALGRWMKRIGYGIGILAVLVIVLGIVGVLRAPDYRQILTPAGYPVNDSVYIPLENGEQVWISVWLPEDLASDQRIPALVETSRYAGQFEPGWLYKITQTYMGSPDLNRSGIQYLLDAGYAFVWIQSPGSCQSTGVRYTEYPPSEVTAMEKVGRWIMEQPWSNGRFGSFGTSYSATTSDMMAATGVEGARAVYAKAPDFDTYAQLVKPGGIASASFVRTWGGMVYAMDRDDLIGMVEAAEGRTYSAVERLLTTGMVAGLKRPDPEDMPVFEQAMRDHQKSPDVETLLAGMAYKDQSGDTGPQRLSLDDVSLYNYTDAIVASDTFMYTRVGWMDAGVAEGALEKFLTMDRPQRLVIQPSGHRFDEIVDPYTGTRPRTDTERAADRQEFFDYFDRHLKQDPAPDETVRKIEYYTYVLDDWRETDVWPPEGITPETWYLAPDHAIVPGKPVDADGSDNYTVDFTATSGPTNRWMTQMGRTAAYGDRSDEDRKLLCYTSAPFDRDRELTGSVTLTLYLSSTHGDGAFFAYLSDVSPDGRVTYLSEQRLRGSFRKETPPEAAPYVPLGVYRSFSASDEAPMVPGRIFEMKLTLLPISTVIRKGHRVRIALAGYDDAVGTRIPETGIPEWTVYRNAAYPSSVTLPLEAREVP